MKLLITGDWHIRKNVPERRSDEEYWTTVCKKIKFILALAAKKDCKMILQPGDFFDSHKANDFLKRYVIETFSEAGIQIITVFGQHDLRYHSSDVNNTPLSVLTAARVVQIASDYPIRHPSIPTRGGQNICIYGASWWEDIPEVKSKTDFNILVMHRMVIKNEKVWDGQEDYELSNILLRTLPYDLIVCGDNHQHFVNVLGNKSLVNCGSLLRTSIAQVNHAPIVYTYDTEYGDLETHLVPCLPFEEVFNMEKIAEEKENDEKMGIFVDRLSGEAGLEGLDFVKNMNTFVSHNSKEIDEDTQGILEEVMG